MYKKTHIHIHTYIHNFSETFLWYENEGMFMTPEEKGKFLNKYFNETREILGNIYKFPSSKKTWPL